MIDPRHPEDLEFIPRNQTILVMPLESDESTSELAVLDDDVTKPDEGIVWALGRDIGTGYQVGQRLAFIKHSGSKLRLEVAGEDKRCEFRILQEFEILGSFVDKPEVHADGAR